MIVRVMLVLVMLIGSSGFGGQPVPVEAEVHLGPSPAWTLPAPAPTQTASVDDAAVRFIYSDTQTKIGSNGTENYFAYRLKVLKPEGLAAGNITASWNPAAGTFTVHRLNVIRDGEVTDVLKSTRFQVLQREGGLEQAMLSGQLTAAIQAPGLRVGDELEFAATIVERDPTLGDHAYGISQLPVIGQSGAFRVRLIWPNARRLTWKTTSDLAEVTASKNDDETELLYQIVDPKPSIPTNGAPLRFNVRRRIEYSDYSSWAELSRQMSSLFDIAATLQPDSPVRQEAAKIATRTPDPGLRALAALQLVQEEVRYVYVGLNGGNYRPATADETWKRRFGDCKAKTALLLALLRELGVPAEAALVNLENGDGVDRHLPSPEVFDHVLVRATVGDKVYWLDGTKLGNMSLANLPPPMFRWALPVRAKDAELVSVPLEPPAEPQLIDVVDIDATAGFDQPARVKEQQILRGEAGAQTRATLSSLPSDGAERALKTYWAQNAGWGLPASVGWRYDQKREALTISMTAEAKLDWSGDSKSGRSLAIPGAGFNPPPELKRPREQNQAAPWATEFPRFSCWVTAIRLPIDSSREWVFRSAPVDQRIGGVAYWRTAGLYGYVMRTVMSKRFFLPEITAEQAAQANAAIAGFDNRVSTVYQGPVKTAFTTSAKTAQLPFNDQTDWLASSALCASPKPLRN